MIDNLGFVYASSSGCSADEIIWTLSKALADLAEGLGVPIKVYHTSRRTSLGDQVADDLSKGKVQEVMQALPGSKDVSARASRVLLSWLQSPAVSMELGRSVLIEMSTDKDLDVQIGISYESAALEMGVNLQVGASSRIPANLME